PGRARGERAGALAQARPRAHAAARAPAAAARRALAARAARALGAPTRSARRISQRAREGGDMTAAADFDPDRDLVLERVVDVPPQLVWKAWTQPEHLVKWFAPKPWTTVDCEIDLRPGGIFRTVMRSPEGVDHPGTGCYLEVTPNERLVWTDAL